MKTLLGQELPPGLMAVATRVVTSQAPQLVALLVLHLSVERLEPETVPMAVRLEALE